MTNKIKKTIKVSKQIFNDCALENGGIIAANPDKSYYPHTAKDYHYVWPRDAAYICVAAKILKIKNIQEPYFNWLLTRPEDFAKEGLLYGNYSTNGRLNNSSFQPDQAGTTLWAIYDFYKNNLREAQKKQELLIRRLADGLCADWQGKYFFHNTTDLWEESYRKTSTKMENNHTYSLAACAQGLLLANKIIKNESWEKTAKEMLAKIYDAYDKKKKYFVRNHGKINDYNIDASLLGLVYPFEIVKSKEPKMVNTVAAMEKNIVENGGLHRYQFDYYDGEGSAQEGGGAWPLLNFWLSIYFCLKGDKKKAAKYYCWVLDKIDENCFIPEQIFSDFRQGIKPLGWSHAMFVVASKFLNYL